MNGGLHDIRPPLPLPGELSLPLIVLSIVAAGALFYLLRRYYRQPQRRARRGLARLRRAVVAGSLERRDAAHALAALLQGQVVVEQGGKVQWNAFSARLAEARFAATPCSAAQLQGLLDEAGSWLEPRR